MFSSLVDFLKLPFQPNQSVVQWLAIIGLIVVVLYFWHAAARDFSLMERDA